MPPTQRVYALTYDELEALRRLQEGSFAPGPDDRAWSYALELGLRHLALHPCRLNRFGTSNMAMP
jgi:hypothetical protein